VPDILRAMRANEEPDALKVLAPGWAKRIIYSCLQYDTLMRPTAPQLLELLQQQHFVENSTPAEEVTVASRRTRR
jgi:hypothetical protein